MLEFEKGEAGFSLYAGTVKATCEHFKRIELTPVMLGCKVFLKSLRANEDMDISVRFPSKLQQTC